MIVEFLGVLLIMVAGYHCRLLNIMNSFVSLLFDFQGGVLVKITEACPPLNCSEKDHILPESQCCSVCRGKRAWWRTWAWAEGTSSFGDIRVE